MTAFEIVFTLLTMITSLALAHLLNGFVNLMRHSRRVRFSFVHGLWGWIAFATLIGNWASFWQMRDVDSWPATVVLLIVLAGTVQYAFCALITPEMPLEGELDLSEFHARDHSLYILAMFALLAISLLLNIALGGMQMYENWWHDSVLTVAALLLSAIGTFVSAYRVQVGVAILILLIVTYYLVVTCNLVVT